MDDEVNNEVNVEITSQIIGLRAPLTDDVRELAGRLICESAEAKFGESGKCQFETHSTWEGFVAALAHAAAPADQIAAMHSKWLARANPYGIGTIHWWVPVGQTLPPSAELHEMLRSEQRGN